MNREKSLCSLFKDLYPSYIDGMVEEETKIWMERHIVECADCFEWIKSHKADIEPNESSCSIQVDTSTFEQDKKAIKKARIVITIGLVAVIMLAIWTSIWIFV